MGTVPVTATATSNRGRKNKPQKPVPKGYLAVKVGEVDGEQQRFVVPVIWFNHPLFKQLLKVAEDEYGFEQPGTIAIPCNVHHFRTVVSRIIDHKHPHQHFGCFRVWAR
ncbi:auxin-responsive protein SAUR32-like [Bidens hawaiensis]|uniref:auxin-responsive protein SAUR32-like n=1 Tax=Bidens hawaiensis TaxID=980011 RepID=UPI00404B7EE6